MERKNIRVLLVGAIMTAIAFPGFAMDAYKTQEMQPYNGKAADVRKSQAIQPYTGKTVDVHKSQEVQPYQGTSPEIHKSQDIQLYKGRDIDVYKTPAVEEYKAPVLPPPAPRTVREKQKAATGQASGNLVILGCKNVHCETREGLMPGLTTVEIVGSFPVRAGKSLLLRIYDTQSKKVIESRKVGIEVSGKMSAHIAAYRYPAATYGFVFTPVDNPKDVLASGRLSTSRTEASGADSQPATKLTPVRKADKEDQTPSAAGVVGTWYGTASTVGTIVLKDDGTYEYGGATGGRYTLESGGIAFSGTLAAWNDGHATLKNGNIEFYWTTAGGWHQWFSFAK